MKNVTFAEYQEAKNEIIGGVEYKEYSTLKNDGVISKQFATEYNGTFYEVNDGGRVEFWSDKHPDSRIYDENEVAEPIPPTALAFGRELAQKIRETAGNAITDFEKFVLDRGFEFETEEALKAGYDRIWKCKHDILITEEEFVIEAGKNYDAEILKTVYAELSELVNQKKLRASGVYAYAHYKWCLRDPEAIVSYQEGKDKWEVNNCDTEVSEDKAKIAVNSEWGFEVSLVQIIGTSYYDATDYQFIRFDCAHMTWLWKNGNLYQVYA